MPEQQTLNRARKAKREGKVATTQAGEFVKEEIRHVRQGKHGVKSPQQAIAIGLSKARRAGVDLPPPDRGSAKTRQKAERDRARGRGAASGRNKRDRQAAAPEPRSDHPRKTSRRKSHSL